MTSHNFHVLSNALKLAEDCKEPEILILAALFHDIGNKLCKLPKVVESECKEDECLKQLGYAYRIEHQYHSVVRTIEILKLLGFTNDTIIRVIDLIIEHDRRKYDHEFVSRSDTELRLHVADVVWMLSEDGIKRDQARAEEHGEEVMSDEDQIAWNTKMINQWFSKELKQFNKLKEKLC